MKYLIFILISQILFTFETGIYFNTGEYENGKLCNEVIKNGEICKDKTLRSMLIPESGKDYILIYKNKNTDKKFIFMFNEIVDDHVVYPVREINLNIYSFDKKMKKYSALSILGPKKEIIEYDVLVEIGDENEIVIYNILNHSYSKNKYKLYKKISEEEGMAIKDYLKLIEEL